MKLIILNKKQFYPTLTHILHMHSPFYKRPQEDNLGYVQLFIYSLNQKYSYLAIIF